ncbi:NADPH dehydrogenase NamA [Bacillaceae bacterium]
MREGVEDVSLLFSPFQVKNVTFANRIMMSPMCMYSAGEDGKATDWHYVHYGAHAIGGVGLMMVEATAVEARGRISERDLGLWSDEQVPPLAKIVAFAHRQGAKIGIQLTHAGRKAEVRGEIVAPSAIPFQNGRKVPHALTREGIEQVVSAFAMAARRAKKAGFDVVEIHGAHGYLIHEFLSPLSNRRDDEYGGSLGNRFRFLKEVIAAVRTEWGTDRPLFLRVSASDYAEGGIDVDMMVEYAKLAKGEGVDVIDVSSGGLLPVPVPAYPGYQVTFAEKIRREAKIPAVTVGMITTPEMAEEILQNGRADMVALARELLRSPNWPLLAAKKMGEEYRGPVQYQRAF